MSNEPGEMEQVPTDSNAPLLGIDNNSFRNMPAGRDRPKKRLPKCCTKCCLITLIILVLVCGAAGIALGVSHNKIDSGVKSMVASQVVMVKGSESVKQWASPSAPVYFKIFMFNLTNPKEFQNGSKPILKEVGPFVYRENKTKFDLVWSEDETILRYNESCNYTFEKSMSNGLDPTKINITSINLPLMGLLVQFEKLLSMVENINSSFGGILERIVKDVIDGFDQALKEEFKENLFMTRSVEEIVWGYKDPFLKFLGDFNLPIAAIPKDGMFRLEEKFSYTGPNMIYTGKSNLKDTARFLMWNGLTSISGWGTPTARMINGTEAIIFHPGVERDDKLELFVSELFRSGYFSYYQDIDEYGVKMYQFRLPVEELRRNNTEKGFFMNSPDGVLNLTAVYPLNVPVFVSKPHFLDADKHYLENVTGLKPIRNKHDAFLNVEPITGATLHAAKRLQINIELRKNQEINELKTIRDLTYLPLLWVEEGGKLNSTQAKQFKDTVYTPLKAIDGSAIGVAALAGFISVLSCLFLFVFGTYLCDKKIKERRNGPLSVQFDD